jgi:Xaa-Pro aminopeptidase
VSRAAAARAERVQAALAQRGIGLAAFADPANLQWLLGRRLDGLERFTALLVSPAGLRVVLPSFDADEFTEASGISAVEGWPDDRGPAGAIASALAALGAEAPAVVAVDAGMPFRFLRELPTPGDGYRSADELVAPLRMVKDETELAAIARTAEIVSKAIDLLPELAVPGVTRSSCEARSSTRCSTSARTRSTTSSCRRARRPPARTTTPTRRRSWRARRCSSTSR